MSAGIGWWIAHVTFWVLLGYGWAWGELGPKGVAAFLCLWVAGYFGLPYLPLGGSIFFSYVALLDVALVFLIFKGDVRLS